MERFLRYFSERTTLFGGRYMPVTDSVSFLRAPLERVVEGFEVWRYPEFGHDMRIAVSPGGFEENLQGLEPLSVGPDFLLTATVGGQWTAVFSSHCSRPAQDVLAHRIGYSLVVDSVDVFLAWPPVGSAAAKGGFGVSVQVNEPTGSFPIKHRYIATLFKWAWGLKPGPARVVHYRSPEPVVGMRESKEGRAPLDRFNPDDLVEWCKGVGLDVFNEDFYLADGYKVTNVDLRAEFKARFDEEWTYQRAQEDNRVRYLVE